MRRVPLVLALLLAACGRGSETTYTVSATNMEPTLRRGDRVVCDKDVPGTLPRGAVVAIDMSAAWFDDGGTRTPRRTVGIHRVVGLPGESVAVEEDGDAVVDGRVLDEPYSGAADVPPVEARRVPERAYYVLGDKRDGSADSRYHGPVPHDTVVAVCTKITSPEDRRGPIPGT